MFRVWNENIVGVNFQCCFIYYQDLAAKVLQIFYLAEPNQMPHIICSPCTKNVCSKMAMDYLEKVEAVVPSVVVTLCKASLALKMGDQMRCQKELDTYSEVEAADQAVHLFGLRLKPFMQSNSQQREPVSVSWKHPVTVSLLRVLESVFVVNLQPLLPPPSAPW